MWLDRLQRKRPLLFDSVWLETKCEVVAKDLSSYTGNGAIGEKMQQQDPSLWLNEIIHCAGNKFSVLASCWETEWSLRGEVNCLIGEGFLWRKMWAGVSLEIFFKTRKLSSCFSVLSFLFSHSICTSFCSSDFQMHTHAPPPYTNILLKEKNGLIFMLEEGLYVILSRDKS